MPDRVIKFGCLAVALATALMLGSWAVPGNCRAETMNFTPNRIILNASGNFTDVQAIFGLALPGFSQLDSCVAYLKFDGQEVADSYSAHYCVVDENLLVAFDRTAVQEVSQEFAGELVEAFVSGEVRYLDSGGNLYTTVFEGTDEVEILEPGRRGSSTRSGSTAYGSGGDNIRQRDRIQLQDCY
jgi:hypothetical protein